MIADAYDEHDALGLAELVKHRHVTPLELLEEAIRRTEALNPAVNAISIKAYDQARATVSQAVAAGPFEGVPFLVKDYLRDVAGIPTTEACRYLLDNVPDRDSVLVERFKRAGLVIFGKTNTPESLGSGTTEPELYGPTRNPWDLTRSAGGSSGGSAAAVAARIVPMAHGNDGGGSLRVPASWCGVFVLKPSRGRNPENDFLIADHVLSRSVRDSAALLDATQGPATGETALHSRDESAFSSQLHREPGPLRMLLVDSVPQGRPVHVDCLDAVHRVGRHCEELGHRVEAGQFGFDIGEYRNAWSLVATADAVAHLEEYEQRSGRRMSPEHFEAETWRRLLEARKATATGYSHALQTLRRTSARVAELFQHVDVVLTPTTAQPPPALGVLNAEEGVVDANGLTRADYFPFTSLFNGTGQPAMSVPTAWNAEGLPMGVQFAGRFGDEATLFRLAGQLERTHGWSHRKPTLTSAEPSVTSGATSD
jgi:amidase